MYLFPVITMAPCLSMNACAAHLKPRPVTNSVFLWDVCGREVTIKTAGIYSSGKMTALHKDRGNLHQNPSLQRYLLPWLGLSSPWLLVPMPKDYFYKTACAIFLIMPLEFPLISIPLSLPPCIFHSLLLQINALSLKDPFVG